MFNIKWRVVVARTLIIVLAGNPLIMAAHGIENAQLAAGQQAAMKRSANGTEVIDIVAPSKKGVSHNKFTQFNVTPDGLILNNSQGPAMSAIGGWTDGNRRLAGGTASLILAEVTSNKRSSLRGYTEVLGDSAEFVLANPNGISCNGCGFINTPRVMLATGTPDLMNGDLMGIDVTGGDVSIDGAGLNASNVDKFDILTRAMRLNAALYANELNIRTGSNYYNFDTLQSRKSSKNPDNSADFEFALDASSLGAMYANRISLIGTEAGLGVRSKGLITSTDSMQLTADGQLELKNTIAGGDLALRSKNADVITHGTTYGKDVSIKLADTLHNNGIIAAADSMDITAAELQQNGNVIAGLNQQGEWLAGASQQLNVSGTLVNRGRIISQGQQQVSAKQLKNTSGSLLQANETTLNTKKLANSGVLNSNALTIKTETAQNAGHIQAQELAIDAQQFKQTQGVVYQAGPNGQLSFAGNNLQLDGGVLVADGDSQINALDSIRNKGTLLTAGDASIETKKLQNTGIMTAGQLNIDATTVTNDSDALIEATQANVSAKSLHNSGTLLATGEQGDSLLLQTDELTNRGRIESHGENLTLSNVELDNRLGQIYQHGDGALQLNFLGDLRNNSGEIYSAGQLNITGGDVDNTGGALQANAIQLNSQHNVNNSAGVINGQAVDLSATTLKNLNGVIQANGTENDSLKLSNIGQLNNDGGTIASHGRDLNLTLTNLSNDNGKLLHLGEGSFNLSQDEALTNSGTIASAGNLILNAEHIDNDGSISADNTLELNATSLNNSQLLYGGNHAEVTAEAINNSGTLAATHLAVSDFNMLQNNGRIESDSASFTGATLNNLDSGVLINAGTQANALQLNVADLNNAGTVHNSSQDMSLGGNLDNSGNIIHAGSGELVLGNLGTIRNADGSIATGGTAKIQNSVTGAGTVYAAQGMELAANSGILVNNSQLYTEGDMQVTSGLNNQGGSLLSDGNLAIHTSDNVTNTGTLQGQNLALNAGVLNNNTGVITSTGSNAAQIDAASLSNNGGVIQSTNDSFSITTRSGELDNSNGQISHDGSSLSLDSASDLNQQSGVIQSTGQLVVKAQDSLNNQEGLIQANAVNVSAEDIDNTSGTFQADALQLSSLKDLNNSSGVINGQAVSLRANTLKNSNGVILATGTDDDSLQLNDIGILNNDSGTIASHGRDFYLTLANLSNDNGDLLHLGEGSFTLSQDETLTNSGTIASAGNLVLNAKNVANEGTLQAQQKLQLNAGLTNQSDALLYANDIAVNAMDGDITNAGSISADNNLDLNATSLNNSQLLYGGNNAEVTAEAINNSGTLAATHLTVSDFSTLQNSGRIESDSASYTGGTLSNLDSGVLINAGTEANALQLNVADLNNAGTVHNSSQDMSLGGNLDNSGSIIHAGSGELVLGNLGTIHNADGSIATGGTAKIQNSVTGAGTVYAAQGMELESRNETLVNNSQLYTEGDMQVTSGLNNQGGSLLSDGNLAIHTSDNVTNTGTLQGQNLALNAGVLNNNTGVITSTGSNAAQIDAASLSNNGGVIQSTNDSFSITTRSGELDNSNGQISHNGSSLTLDSASDLKQQSGIVQSTGQLMVNALGDLNNSEGTIQASGDLTLSAAELNNHKGMLAANGDMQLAGSGISNNAGIIAAGSQLEVIAGQLSNDGGALEAEDIRIELSENFSNNQGTVFASDKLNIDAGTIDNSLGTLASNGELKLDIAKALTNREGLIQAGTVNVSAEDIDNTSGTIQANALELSSLQELNNSGGTIASAGNLLLNAEQVNNDGRISAENDLELNARTLNNNQLLYAGNNAKVAAETITNSGTLAATHLAVSDFNMLQNSGRMESDSASYTGATLNNLDSGVLINAGTEANSLQLNVADLNNAGTVHNSSQDMSLGGNLSNSGSVIHAGTGELVLGNLGTIHNAGGSIATGGTAKIQNSVTGAGTVYAAQGMELAANSGILVNNSQLYTEGGMQVTSGLNNQGGSLLSDGNLTINTSDNVTNTGTLQGQNLALTSGVLNNNTGVITSTGSNVAQIDAVSLSNNRGLIQSTNDSFSISTRSGELDNSNGQISHNGSSLTLESASDLNQQSGVVQSTGQLVINTQGNLNNNEGTLQTASDLHLNTEVLNNQRGKVLVANSAIIDAGQFNNNEGILTADDIGMELSGELSNNQGTVFANDKLSIDAGTIDNSLGTLASNGELKLGVTKALTNRGGLIQAGTVNVSAEDIDNTSGTVQANALELSSLKDLNNSGGIIASAGNLLLNAEEVNNDGRISAENNLELNATNLNNSQLLYGRNNAAVNAETITNSGTLAATQLTVSDFGLLQNSGRIESDSASYTGGTLQNLANGVLINAGTQANALQLNVAELNNAGTVHNSSQDMSLGGNLSNSGSVIHAGTGNLVLGSDGTIHNAGGSIASAGTAKIQDSVTGAGTVYAAQGMELASSSTFVNNSQLYTKGNILVNSALDNQGGSLLSDGNLTINTSNNVTNSGTLQGQNLDLTAGVLNNNAGVITSTGNGSAEIDAASLSNSGGVIQSTNDNFTINTRTGGLDNSNGQISHDGSNLTLDSASHLNQQSGVVQSTGQLAVNAEGNLNNTGGVLTGSQYQLNSGGTLNNNDGRIVGSGSGASSIESGALVNRSGYIAANGNNLTLNTAALDNNAGSILLAGSGNLAITATSVANDAGSSRIISNGAINLNGGTELKNAGQISSAKQLSLNAKTIGNSGTLASRAGKVDIDSTGTLTNSGTVSGATAVDLDVRTLNNRNGKVQSDGTVAIDVNSLNVGQIQARNITLDSNNSIALQSNESISASGNIDLNTNANINNSGTIVASGTLIADAKELANKASGLIRSGGNATLDANKLTNNGTVSSNSVLRLDIANTSNTGTLAAGTQLDINGNINNSNLLFASNLLTVDGNVSNTGNIYSNRDAAIKGTTVTNTGGSIAAARDLSISGKILNTYTGDFSYTSGSPETTTAYPYGNPLFKGGTYSERVRTFSTTKEIRTSRTYQSNLNGKAGVIAAGRNLGLSGDITNDFGTISAVGNLVLSGTNLTNNSAKSRKETEVTVTRESWEDTCLQGYSEPNGRYFCAEPGMPKKVGETETDTYTEVTYLDGGNYGTITAGNISGNLSGSIELNDVTPSDVNGSNVNTNANGSRGSASRGSSASNNNNTKVVVIRSNGNAQNTNGADRSGIDNDTVEVDWRDNDAGSNSNNDVNVVVNRSKGNAQDTTGANRSGIDNDTVELDWRNNDVRPTSPKNVEVAVSLRNGNTQNTTGASRSVNGVTGIDNDTIEIDGRDNNTDVNVVVNRTNGNSQNITDAERLAGTGNVTMPADNAELIKTSSPNKLGANSSGFGVQGVGFMTPDMADSLRMSQGVAPEAPGVQQGGGTVGNGNIANDSDYNPDLIIKGLVDDQKGTLAQQKESLQQQEGIQQQKNAQQQVAGQRAGQNVFITDEQMRVLTEDLGFDADAINQGQEGLYSAISQNDLLEDGVTLSATGVIDITADAGLNIDSGIAAGEGLILRSDGGLNMGDYGHFDSDNLLGLQLGGDFTNDMSLESDTLWFDIGGDFTNQGELTGNDVLSINAGDDLINQSLLSGGNVMLNAGGDIVNRTEFTQHTREYSDGGSRTYTLVGDSPEIISGESLSMNAGNNLDLQGSQLGAAGDISLHAGNDVLLNAVEKENGHEKYFKGGYDIELDRTYDVVSLEAGGNLSVVAGNNLESEGAQFGAGGVASLAAGNEMNLMAVVESHYDADKKTKKSFLKKKVTETVSHHEEVQGTAITAENILLNATVDSSGQVVEKGGGDITLEGGELNASENIIGFGEDITLTAGTYQDYEYSHTSKSSFGGLKSKSREELAQDDLLDGSTLSAGGNILLNAGNNLNILASQLDGDNIGLTAFNDVLIASGEESSIRESRSQSGGFFSGGSLFSSTEALTGSASITADSSVIDASGNIVIDAGSATVIGSSLDADEGIAVKTDIGDIQVLAAEERTETYSREEKIDIGFDAVLKALTRPDELIQSEDGQLKLSLGSATYDKVDFASESTSHKGSELNAGGSVSLDSVADVIIEGSEIDAGGNANLIAGGDVVVKEAEDSYSETKEEIHGSAEMSVVVQHQAVEVAKAAVAVDDAKDQVKQAKADYRKYQKEKDQLENTLAQLEADYANGVAGVNHADIVELRNLLDDVKGDEEWYVAGIATAAANLASKTTLLVQQTAAAAQSTASYGFNAGVQLDIAASKTDSSLDATSSLASTINGTNINVISGGDGLSGNTLIQGSALNAAQNLNILTGELDVLASQDTQRSETDTQSGSMTVAQTVWGAAGGPTVNASLNSSKQQDKQTTHNNSTLTANNLNIATTDDATIIGGNLHGANAVNMDIGGDLTLESVQDRFSGSNKGIGISGGMSLGGVFTNENGAKANSKEVKTTAIGKGGDVSSVNGGVNASSGRYRKTETVLSSITGGTVDVSVDGNTQLTGALLAAVDAEGNDTGNLSLNTGSLNTTDLTNRSYSSNQSFGVNASVGVSDAANPADPAQSDSDLALNSSNYSYQNESSQSLDKTLATIGEGSVSVNGEDTSPEGVNRDVAQVNKEIYDVDRQQGNIDLTVDHRLLSEDGRKQIAEDAKRTKIMGESIIDAVADSVSLTGSGEGEDSLRDHMGNKQDYFTATKNFTQNPANAEHVKTLSDDNATPEQKQAAYTALVNEIAVYMGVDPTEAKVLMANDPRFAEVAGAHSRDTDTVYVDDAAHDNASKAVNTVGHETQHYLDNQQNPDAEQTETYHDNREEYAVIMGDATEDYLGFNFAQNDTSLADGNSHSFGSNMEEAKRNLDLVSGNNTAYSNENSDALDSRYLHPEERELAEKLAGESGGQFTAEEMRDVLRHALPSDAKEYPQGLSDYVLDTAQATDETLQYMDGSEGRLIVTQDENGEARYVIQDIGSIPLNEDAKAYVQEQDLGYSFIKPVSPDYEQTYNYSQDPMTGRFTDDSGQYTVGYNVDGTIYSVPQNSCATVGCIAGGANIGWSTPEAQVYQKALNAKALDDASTAATAGLLLNPVGGTATFLTTTSIGAGLSSAHMNDEFFNEAGQIAVSEVVQVGLENTLGKRTGVRVNTLLDLSGLYESTMDFIPEDSKLIEDTNNLISKDDDESK